MIENGSIKHLSTIQRLCQPLLEQFDIHHFSAGITTLNHSSLSLRALCNRPDAFSTYFEKQYFDLDTIAFHLFRRKMVPGQIYTSVRSPYYDSFFKSLFVKKRIIEALKNLGITQCITLMKIDNNTVTNISFGTNNDHPGFATELLSKINVIRSFGDQFINKTETILDELTPYAVNSDKIIRLKPVSKLLNWMGLPADPQSLQECGKYYQLPKRQEKDDEQPIIQGEMRKDPLQLITKRELECLAAYSKGDSAKIIAKKLFLSTRTVENHIYNARKKIGAKSNADFYRILQQLFINSDLATTWR